jgi:glucose/arabinose dehydrogenase
MYHTGGNIHFRPSDPTHIYVTIGDKGVGSDAQDLTKWNGKILRIGSDGSIPADNPFYDDGNPAAGADDRVWAFGLRNSFDFCFSTVNDSLYASENGVSTYDEVNLIKQGGNYGWPYCEGIAGSCAGYEVPFETFGVAVPALTGVIFYTSNVMPALTNHLLVVDYNHGNIHNLVLGNAPAYNTFVSRSTLTGGFFQNLTDIEQGPDGCVYVSEINAGKISKFCTIVGVNEVEKENAFTVYPNPVINEIQVAGEGVIITALLDSHGKLLETQNGNKLNMAKYAPGIYFLRVNQTHYVKIIKE